MQYLYKDLGVLTEQNAVTVTLRHRANVRLMTAANYDSFKRGGAHTYVGGKAVRTPVVLNVPHSGHWVVVVDLGGAAGSVEASVTVR